MHQEYPVRLIKWHIIFFGDNAIASFNDQTITIRNVEGVVLHQFIPENIKDAGLNTINGMWTINLKHRKPLHIVGSGSSKSDFNSKLEEMMGSISIHRAP